MGDGVHASNVSMMKFQLHRVTVVKVNTLATASNCPFVVLIMFAWRILAQLIVRV